MAQYFFASTVRASSAEARDVLHRKENADVIDEADCVYSRLHPLQPREFAEPWNSS
jgi:hypothetical protein